MLAACCYGALNADTEQKTSGAPDHCLAVTIEHTTYGVSKRYYTSSKRHTVGSLGCERAAKSAKNPCRRDLLSNDIRLERLGSHDPMLVRIQLWMEHVAKQLHCASVHGSITKLRTG